MSLSFDGVDDVVDCGTPALLNDAQPFSIVAWIYPKSLGGGGGGGKGRIFCKENVTDGNGSWNFFATGTNQLKFAKNNSSQANRISGNNAFSFNRWTPVAMTWSGSNVASTSVNLYSKFALSNGAASSGSGSISDASLDLCIGNTQAAVVGFNGFIQYLQFFNRVISLNEIIQCSTYPGSLKRSLIGFWPLSGNSSTEPDYSGNKNHGAVTGAINNINNASISGMWFPRTSRNYSFGNPRAILNVNGAQLVSSVAATSIDSSNGNAVSDQDGTITDTVNWTAPQTTVAAAAPTAARRKLRALLGVGL